MKTVRASLLKGFLCLVVLGGISFAAYTIASSTDTLSNDEVRQNISEKLNKIYRMQNAIKTLQEFDEQDTGGTQSNIDAKEAALKASDLSKDVDSIVSEFEKLQSERKETDERYKIVLDQIKKVVIDIRLTKDAVSSSVTKINLYSKRMVDTLEKLQQTRDYIQSSQDTLVKLLPAMYMIQNDYTNDAGEIDDIKLFLGQGNISETLSYDDMMLALSTKLDTLLIDLDQAQTSYAQAFKDMYKVRSDLKESTIAYKSKIKVLEEQKAYLLYFFDLYRSNKLKLDSTITNLFETRDQLKNKIHILINNLEKTKELVYAPIDSSGTVVNRVMYDINNINYKTFIHLYDKREDTRYNFFGWPTLPVKSIIASYGGIINIGGDTETLEGVQLAAEQGQSIYAPANGYVYYVQDQDGMTINWMMIVHNDGYVTVLTNLQKVLVRSGDIVKRGQIIALAGGQAGTRGAGWFSTTPMVNMQIYKDGKTIDPLSVLDLSIFNSASQVPADFQDKYNRDVKERNSAIDFSTVDFVNGDSDWEKRDNFLKKYAKAPYNDITLWEQAVSGTNIDTDLGICIGYAETSLGRAFASANNIGNVGNNDRGDRVDKDSPLDGAHAIYTTLNNGYLGGYSTIFELSGYGNKEGAIYASSEYNRQKNVSRCLSTIKGYIVPEDYPFRTYSAK